MRIAIGDVIQFSDSGPSIRFIAYQTPDEQATHDVLYLHIGADVHSFPSGTLLIGSAEDCDCIVNGVEAHHALLQYEDGICRVKNLTENDAIILDGKLQKFDATIQDDASLQVGRDGPRFKYLGNGRLIKLKEAQQTVSSDELRTYIIPAPKPSLLDKFKRSKS